MYLCISQSIITGDWAQGLDAVISWASVLVWDRVSLKFPRWYCHLRWNLPSFCLSLPKCWDHRCVQQHLSLTFFWYRASLPPLNSFLFMSKAVFPNFWACVFSYLFAFAYVLICVWIFLSLLALSIYPHPPTPVLRIKPEALSIPGQHSFTSVLLIWEYQSFFALCCICIFACN